MQPGRFLWILPCCHHVPAPRTLRSARDVDSFRTLDATRRGHGSHPPPNHLSECSWKQTTIVTGGRSSSLEPTAFPHRASCHIPAFQSLLSPDSQPPCLPCTSLLERFLTDCSEHARAAHTAYRRGKPPGPLHVPPLSVGLKPSNEGCRENKGGTER